MNREQLLNLSMSQLRTATKESGLTVPYNATKVELVNLLLDGENKEKKDSPTPEMRRKKYLQQLKVSGDQDGFTLKLSAETRKGFHRRWVNDTPGRIRMLETRGYEIVNEHSKPLSRHVGIDSEGKSLRAFLMEIPSEWHNEDTLRKTQYNKEITADLLQMKASDDDKGFSKNDQQFLKGEVTIDGEVAKF